VIVAVCQHANRKKFGTTKAGTGRFRCKDCGKTFTASTELFDGMRIDLDRAAQIIGMLVEGSSVSAVARITDTDPHTIIDLMVLVGERCESFMAEQIRGIQVDDVQCDEIWQFIFCKNATAAQKKYVGGCGDSWCWTAIERNTKLMVTWHMGRRAMDDNHAFMRKLAVATTGRFHLSTDGYRTYEDAVRWNLGQRVDYGQVQKIYGKTNAEEQRKYSPARIIGCSRRVVSGKPELRRTSTSHCERMNGSIRNFTKRMGRLTYCFSKRWANHKAALALFFCHYNWCRKHRSLKGQTPAMASGLSSQPWNVRELLQRVCEAG
jgi:IS1 family transposase/transposase-like protein